MDGDTAMPSIRVLVAHDFYRRRGGEDTVVEREQALLRARGHEVRLFAADNATIRGPLGKARAAWNATEAPDARRRLGVAIADFRPNVVHVHNFFPLLSPSLYDACAASDVAVVQTLHNYRTICPGALLWRDGHVCEDCVAGSPYQAVAHGCYRGSRLASLAAARMVDRHRRAGTWRTKVDRFIALGEFAKGRFVAAGFPADKIDVKANFATDPGEPDSGKARSGALFVGRLSPEKGLDVLLAACRNLDVRLRIAGDGPVADSVCRPESQVVMLGALSPRAVAGEMTRAAFLVMPSTSYETFGLVVVEAFSHGLPVIASRLGALAEIVDDGETGLHFTPGDSADLADKIRWAVAHPDAMRQMGAMARRVYCQRYTPEANYRMLRAIYQRAIAADNRVGGGRR